MQDIELERCPANFVRPMTTFHQYLSSKNNLFSE